MKLLHSKTWIEPLVVATMCEKMDVVALATKNKIMLHNEGASAHRAHRALRQTRHLPVKCTPFSDRCFVKCYSKMFGSHCNVWFPMLCFQAVSKCLVSTAMFVSQCFVLKRSQNVWFPLQCLFPNALF